jgi:hypothetical protein
MQRRERVTPVLLESRESSLGMAGAGMAGERVSTAGRAHIRAGSPVAILEVQLGAPDTGGIHIGDGVNIGPVQRDSRRDRPG